MPTISLCMIVKNEEDIIQRCLDSVQEVCDEIIIVDTGSVDATFEKLKKYPQIKLHHFEWVYDFGAARRESFKHATKELILWLDADDIIYPKDLEILKQIKNTPLDQLPDCLLSKYQYSHDDHGNVILSHYRERILKRSTNPTWKYKIHECVPLTQFKTTDRTPFEVHHFRTEDTSERNLTILKRCIHDPEENCARYEFYYGKECADRGKNKQAKHYLQKYLKHWDYYEDAYFATYKLAMLYFDENKEETLKLCFDALKLDQRRAEVFCLLGLLYISEKRWDFARFWYETALLMPQPDSTLGFFDLDYYNFIPHSQLTFVYANIGDNKKAFEHVKKALKYRPSDSKSKYNYDYLNPSKKVAFYIPFDYSIDNPNIRLRKINPSRAIENAAVVKDFKELFNYDYIVTHSFFSDRELESLKIKGKIIAYDYAEGVIEEDTTKELSKYHYIFCSSPALVEVSKKYNINSVWIPDAFEA